MGAGLRGLGEIGGYLPNTRELFSGVRGCGVRGASASHSASRGRRGPAAPALGRAEGRKEGGSRVLDCRVG